MAEHGQQYLHSRISDSHLVKASYEQDDLSVEQM